jgi:hypothetical protein
MTHFREPAQQLFPSYAFVIPRVFQLMFERLPNAEKPFSYLLLDSPNPHKNKIVQMYECGVFVIV